MFSNTTLSTSSLNEPKVLIQIDESNNDPHTQGRSGDQDQGNIRE